MLVSKPRKEAPSPEKVRQQVDQIMADWQSYPDFAHLFRALLKANGNSRKTFTSYYTQATHMNISRTRLQDMLSGDAHPTYQFVAALADYALLGLDLGRVRQASAETPCGDHRLALFTTAGLIEVTPDTIDQWNQEVLSGWQRRIKETPGRQRPNWKELMRKLIEFHTQGGRADMGDIALAANAAGDLTDHLDARDVEQLLFSRDVPSAGERRALARAVGLSSSQTDLIEAAVENGSLALSARRTPTEFSALLGEMLERLRGVNISQQQLVLYTLPVGGTEPGVSEGTLSGWKHGVVRPTLSPLRSLVRGLERCHPFIAREEIQNLVSAAGFSHDDLAATTHDLVSRIDNTTRLKPLLVALRNASDLDVPVSAAAGLGGNVGDADLANYTTQISSWERDKEGTIPTETQLLDLMARYNSLLQQKGREELSAEEIQRVVEVARRDREDGKARGFHKRARELHPIVPRRTITPGLDDTPSR